MPKDRLEEQARALYRALDDAFVHQIEITTRFWSRVGPDDYPHWELKLDVPNVVKVEVEARTYVCALEKLVRIARRNIQFRREHLLRIATALETKEGEENAS